MDRRKHHDGYFPLFQVLLIGHILVARHEYIEATRFRSRQQIAILKPFPALLLCRGDFMTVEQRPQRPRNIVIEQDFQGLSIG